MGIRKLYYEIFADSIEASAKNGRLGTKERHLYIILVVSLAQYLNIILLMIILTGLGLNVNLFLDVKHFPGKMINSFLSGLITLVLPLMLINYFLVFHNKTYLKYTDNRRIKTGGWALMIYFMGSAFAFIMYMVIGKLFF